MTQYLLDTNTLIEGLFPPGEGHEYAVSVLTFSELITGVHAARTPALRVAKQARYDAVSARFDPVPVTASVLEAYWEIDHAEITAGRKPRKRRIDLLLAATARSAGWTVWTANRADFSGVEHLVDVDGPDESPPIEAR